MAWLHFLGSDHLIPKDPRFTARGKSVNILFASVDYCVRLQMRASPIQEFPSIICVSRSFSEFQGCSTYFQGCWPIAKENVNFSGAGKKILFFGKSVQFFKT